jgi:cyclohexanecarboxylate-CoA ligase
VKADARFAVPAALREQYYRAGHWRSDDLWTSFSAVVTRHPQATALVDGERTISFAELQREAERFSTALQDKGLGAGQVVAIHGRHCIESAIAILGCAHAGVVVALLPHMFSAEQIGGILDNSEARALVAIGEPSEVERSREAGRGRRLAVFVVLDSARASGAPADATLTAWSAFIASGNTTRTEVRTRQPADELALLMFSSGTTGEPKGVMHSANTLRFAAEAYCGYQSIDAADTSLVVTAFGFIGSSVLGTYLTFLCGCRTIMQRTWKAEETLHLIKRHRVTHFLLMPTHAIDILGSPELDRTDCSSVSRGVVAGVNEAYRREAQKRLCARPYPMYGMSESPAHVTGSTVDDLEDLWTTEGKTLPGTELLICDDEDRPVPVGTHGNILVRGPNRFLGYYRNDALNQSSLTPAGFFRTGDVGFLDEAGFMTFVTRSKDIIRRGGVTITPADIETALRGHPRIADVAVIGLPDPRLGERACACVITRDGQDMSLPDITDFLGSIAFARYLWPEAVVICQDFPRTPSLKVQKNELRKQVLAGDHQKA